MAAARVWNSVEIILFQYGTTSEMKQNYFSLKNNCVSFQTSRLKWNKIILAAKTILFHFGRGSVLK